MDDLAGSTIWPPQILVLGDWARTEMSPVREWVQNIGVSARVFHQPSLTMPEKNIDELGTASPDMVVVCQSWPDEFSAAEVAVQLGRWPLALWVCCFGCWCESDGRTRTIWPIGIRVPARVAVARLKRLWAIVTGRLQGPLPITASRDEAYEFDATFLSGRFSEACDVRGRAFIVRSPDPVMRQWLCNLVATLDVMSSTGNRTALIANTIVLWDVDPDWSQATDEIKVFVMQNVGTKIIALAGLPHPDFVESLLAVGVEAVVTKAYATSQIAGLFARV